MPALDDEISIVETLRLKTEESDIKQYLKSTVGGYTKNSVLEYLNVLRKQQQSMTDTFSRNQQLLFEEKEKLRKTNENLKTRLRQAQAEYQELSQTLKIHELEDGELSASDIFALKSKVSAVEDELNKSMLEKARLEKQIEYHKSTEDDITQKLAQSEQEKLSIKEILKGETSRAKELNAIISKLSGEIEARDEEIKFLNSLLSEGKIAKLTQKVSELTQQLSSQAEVLEIYNNESSLKTQTIESLNTEKDKLSALNAELTQKLESITEQNEKQCAANKAFTELLENEYKKSLTLIKEKSAAAFDKLSAESKLSEAVAKITMLELQLKKQTVAEETEALYMSKNSVME